MEEKEPAKEVFITGYQYLVLKALLKAASDDLLRANLMGVFYDHPRDQFVATDGHILRIEKLAWIGDDKPENSFLLRPVDLMLTAAQIRLRYGAEQNTKDLEEILVPLEYTPDDKEGAYPNYSAVLPSDAQRFPREWICMSPDLLASIKRTFYEVPRGLTFQFSGELKGILLYADAPGEDRRLAGLMMPMRVLGEKPEPLFEIVDKETGEVAANEKAEKAVAK